MNTTQVTGRNNSFGIHGVNTIIDPQAKLSSTERIFRGIVVFKSIDLPNMNVLVMSVPAVLTVSTQLLIVMLSTLSLKYYHFLIKKTREKPARNRFPLVLGMCFVSLLRSAYPEPEESNSTWYCPPSFCFAVFLPQDKNTAHGGKHRAVQAMKIYETICNKISIQCKQNVIA